MEVLVPALGPSARDPAARALQDKADQPGEGGPAWGWGVRGWEGRDNPLAPQTQVRLLYGDFVFSS